MTARSERCLPLALIEAVDEAMTGQPVQVLGSWTGRPGRSPCLAVSGTFASFAEWLLLLTLCTTEDEFEDLGHEVSEMVRGVAAQAFGEGMVFYFPGWRLTGPDGAVWEDE